MTEYVLVVDDGNMERTRVFKTREAAYRAWNEAASQVGRGGLFSAHVEREGKRLWWCEDDGEESPGDDTPSLPEPWWKTER